jgi:hypothetical protein
LNRYVEAGKRRKAFHDMLGKVRVKSIRRLLKLYYYSQVEPIERYQIRRNSRRQPRVYPGINAVMEALDCNKTTAMDYLNAVDIIKTFFVARRRHAVEKVEYNVPEDVWDPGLRPR